MRTHDTQIHAVWFVTRPTPDSTLGDICFVCYTARDMQHHFMGGLNGSDVVAMFTDKGEAEARARQELADLSLLREKVR